MVEVARLESVYRFIAYRGFESPSLRQGYADFFVLFCARSNVTALGKRAFALCGAGAELALGGSPPRLASVVVKRVARIPMSLAFCDSSCNGFERSWRREV